MRALCQPCFAPVVPVRACRLALCLRVVVGGGVRHTWGEHEHGLDYQASNWSNAAFAKLRTAKPAGYQNLESTWWEQRRIGINGTREALRGHPLGTSVEKELAAYEAACAPAFAESGVDPTSLGWVAVPSATVSTTTLTLGDVTVGFDAASGAVRRLQAAGEQWAAADRLSLGLEYTTYSQANFSVYLRGYSGIDTPPGWFMHDFGKPGDSGANFTRATGVLQRMWTRSNATEALLLLVLSSQQEASVEYGGAQRYYLHVTLQQAAEGSGGSSGSGGRPSLLATLHVVDKTPTRHAEALFLTFNPPQAQDAENGSVELGKLGQWMAATRNLTVDGGSKVLHGVQDGVRVVQSRRHLRAHTPPSAAAASATMTVEMLDAGVVSLGRPNAFPIALHVNASHPWDPPDVERHGFSSMLFNNLWGTNYVMWQPYRREGQVVPSEANFAFRYKLTWSTA